MDLEKEFGREVILFNDFLKLDYEKMDLVKDVINFWNSNQIKSLHKHKKFLMKDVVKLNNFLDEILRMEKLENVVIDGALVNLKRDPATIDKDQLRKLTDLIFNLKNFIAKLQNLKKEFEFQLDYLDNKNIPEALLVKDIEEHGKFYESLVRENDLNRGIRLYHIYIIKSIKDFVKNIHLKKPLISVIIPAYNEEEYLKKAVHSVKNQTYPNKEIIVVNNLSDDKTGEQVKPYTYYHVYLKKKGVSIARNTGVKLAHGEILVFLDADSIMERNLLEKVWEEVELKNYVGGTCKLLPDKSSWKNRNFMRFVELCKLITLAPSGIMFCRKKDFFEVGGFDESKEVAEDVEFLKKLGKIGKKEGMRLKEIRDSYVLTSVRRFEERRFGYLKTFMDWGIAYLFPWTRKKYKSVQE